MRKIQPVGVFAVGGVEVEERETRQVVVDSVLCAFTPSQRSVLPREYRPPRARIVGWVGAEERLAAEIVPGLLIVELQVDARSE